MHTIVLYHSDGKENKTSDTITHSFTYDLCIHNTAYQPHDTLITFPTIDASLSAVKIVISKL